MTEALLRASGSVERDNKNESSAGTSKSTSPSTASSSPDSSSPVTVKSPPNGRIDQAQDFDNRESEEASSPSPHQPSEWLTEVCPKRSPYFPQYGDELVYYRQGHEDYVRFVEKNNLYEMSEKFKKTLPYVAHPKLRAAIPWRVDALRFFVKQSGLVLAILKLQVMDWLSAETTELSLIVQYHDVVNVVDFLILRQVHDKYVRQYWNPGDRFRCLICGQWWVGTVVRFQPYDKRFPQSKLLCHWITWESGESERLSPWDMDVIPDSFVVNEAAEATEEEIRSGLYKPNRVDWPPRGDQEEQCAKLSRLFVQVMGLAISEPFLYPVDIDRYPIYSKVIAYPIDLWTIKARLDNRFYRRRNVLKFDLMCLASNAERINERNSDIVKHAQIIRDMCLELVMNPDTVDILPVYRTVVESCLNRNNAPRKRNSSIVNGNSSLQCSSKAFPIILSSAATAIPSTSQRSTQHPVISGGSFKSRRRNNKSNAKVDCRSWKEKCGDLLEKMWQHPDSTRLRVPIDPLKYPGYYDGIDSPLDLQSVKGQLVGGHYASPLDFDENMRLIFDNFMHYQTDEKSQIYKRTNRLQSMYECLVDPILTAYRSKNGVTSHVVHDNDLDSRSLIEGPLPDMTPVIDEYILLLADYNPIAFQITFHDLVCMIAQFQLQDNASPASNLDC